MRENALRLVPPFASGFGEMAQLRENPLQVGFARHAGMLRRPQTGVNDAHRPQNPHWLRRIAGGPAS